MAKKRLHDVPPTSKMTVMVFHFEGSDASMQEGFRTLNNALTSVVPAQLHLTASQQPRLAAAEEDTAGGFADCDGSDDTVIDATAVSTPPAPPRKRTERSPNILDLNLSVGDTPLKLFLTELDVSATSKRYLAISYWLKKYHDLDEVTSDHIHTCFRFMGWQTPKIAAQPLRKMKAQGWYHKGAEEGGYKINHVGENEVLKMLEPGAQA